MISWSGSGSCRVACFVISSMFFIQWECKGQCCIKFWPILLLIHVHGQYGKPQLFLKVFLIGFHCYGQFTDCSNAKKVTTVQQRIHKTVCCVVSVLTKLHSTTVTGAESGPRQAFLKEVRFSLVTYHSANAPYSFSRHQHNVIFANDSVLK